MSILRPDPPYDLFEEVNVGRRIFIVHEDHGAKTSFRRKMLIGFGAILLAAALSMLVCNLLGGNDNGVGELPHMTSVFNVLGQDRKVAEKALRSADARVIYDPAIKGYRLEEVAEFAGHQMDALITYDTNNKLHSVTYVVPSAESPRTMAIYACQLLESTQDAWGYARGTLFNKHRIQWDAAELEKTFSAAEAWQQEITWIVNRDIASRGFVEGDCISIRFHVEYPGNAEVVSIYFTVGPDTAEADDFTYDPVPFINKYG